MGNYHAEREKKNIYNKDDLKRIPILDVAADLGIRVTYRSGKAWCSIRSEDHTPSVLIHPDENTFKDFGTGEKKADVIEFTRRVLGTDFQSACQWLGDRYSIEPINNKAAKKRPWHELEEREYDQIGLYGELATKNFRFDIDRLPVETIASISERYAMPMNELRKKHPKTYSSILVQTAIPYVNNLRTDYLLKIWSADQLFQQMGCKPGFFEEQCRAKYFDKDILALESAEQILYRAAHGTKLKVRQPKKYDPIQDLADMKEGTLKPRMGTISYNELEKRSEKTGSKVRYTPMPFYQYTLNETLREFPHNAFMNNGTVFVGYLSQDHDKFLAAIESRESLSNQVEMAQSQTQTTEYSVDKQKEVEM